MATQNMVRTPERKEEEKNPTCDCQKQTILSLVTALDLFKCLKQIKQESLLLTCAPISELPSNISTMVVEVLFVSFWFLM